MKVRAETPADYPAVRRVTEAAFGRPAEADLVERIRNAPGFRPELSLVAVEDGEVIGHVLMSPVGLERGPEADPVDDLLCLAPISVQPDHQRAGIGAALMWEALDRAARAGARAVILLGHPAYYPRFGFQKASDFGLRTTYDVPAEVFMALPLRTDALKDCEGLVIFPPAFDGV